MKLKSVSKHQKGKLDNMDTIIVATILIIIGLASTLGGYLLFRLLLPFYGFIAGFGLGFSGIQALFGANVWSYTASLITAFVIGLLFAALSYFYYTIAVMVISGTIVAGAFAFLGQAVGLNENGFVIFLLSLTGAIIGGLAVLRYGLQHSLAVVFTSLFGVSALLASLFLLFGDLSISELHQNGILQSVGKTVDSSWIWLFVLLGGTLFASALQRALIVQASYDSPFIINEKGNVKKIK